MGLRDQLRNPFSFLFVRSRSEDRIAQYVIREHRRGRDLKDILEDNYVRNRCTPAQIQRMLDQPAVIHALGESEVARARDAQGP
jgi:hypothetical protein